MSELTALQAQEALDAYYRHGKNKARASIALGLPTTTYKNRLEAAHRLKLTSSFVIYDSTHSLPPDQLRILKLEKEVAELKSLNKLMTEQSYDLATIKELIHDCSIPPSPPKWTVAKSRGTNTGIPNLLVSDVHFDEKIEAAQVNYVNAYNRPIAEKRLKTLFTTTTDLLMNHFAKPNYDHLIVAFGGDMLSGNIHEELRETNVSPIAQSIMALTDNLIGGLDLLLENFRIKIYAISGNHGRWDKKPRYKHKQFESYEWLLYQFMSRHYKNDDRIHFNISDSSDLIYQVYDYRYCLTHGDQAHGGSGVSGMMSPLMLMDHRKRKRATAIKQPFDVILAGHWHSLLFGRGMIINGSVKGYDEYAFEKNFDFELPQQALWLNHPVWGMTARWPILLEKPGTIYKNHAEIYESK